VKVLITTTINVPTVLKGWSIGLDEEDHIIVIGDQKTPHQDVINVLRDITGTDGINTRYMAPDQQTHWSISDVLGWNTIQRRNIGLLEALKLRPDHIITIDDDNEPMTDDQITRMINVMETPGDTDIVTGVEWYNPGSACTPNVTHRGFPLSQRHADIDPDYAQRFDVDIAVGAMLWVGDPDIDAIERMVLNPTVNDVEFDTITPPGVWAPFNSQATVYRYDVAPLMFMFPGIGRYDDIWASYLARRVMDHFNLSVYYGNPAVRQTRNEHDVIVDLSHEMFGMTFTDEFVAALKEVDLNGCATIIQALDRCFAAIHKLDFMPTQTRASLGLWVADLMRANVV